MRKAMTLDDANQALRLNEPVGPDHEFYTDFGGMRGEFEERFVYKALAVRTQGGQLVYNPSAHSLNKSFVFLGGMRGTGKTSELLHYEKNLNSPACFFVVFCRLDLDLNLKDMEYMDILILQLEKLAARLKAEEILVNEGVIASMYEWFSQQTTELRDYNKAEAQVSMGGGLKKDGLLSSLLGLFAELKFSMTAGTERTNSLRRVFKNNFAHFSNRFNEFVGEAALAIRAANKGQDILFIVDGLEKTHNADTRRRIVIDESSKIREINANTLFILPIELMKERLFLRQLTEFVTSFPNLKVQDRQGNDRPEVLDRLVEFVYKRLSPNLFADNEQDALVKEVVRYSGGNPRELLRILSYAALNADEQLGKIDRKALGKGLKKLANETAAFLTGPQLDKLRELYQNPQTPYDSIMDKLIEDVVVYEYNDGTDRRVNPILKLTDIYQQRVLQYQPPS